MAVLCTQLALSTRTYTTRRVTLFSPGKPFPVASAEPYSSLPLRPVLRGAGCIAACSAVLAVAIAVSIGTHSAAGR
jgi:hypothetical protein